MRFALCDDLKQDRDLLRTHLRDALAERRIAADIEVFDSGDALLEHLFQAPFDAYFLDIYMKGMTGVQTAYRLLEKDARTVIVFITSSPDHMADGFQIGAVHYLVKPVTPESVGQALERVLRLLDKPEAYITLQIGRMEKQVLLEDIVFVESRERQCLIHTRKEIVPPYIRLDELQAMLDNRFLRCHRSYLINMDETDGLFSDGFLMSDGVAIPVKRDKRLEMKQRFEQYCFDKLRKGMR